MHFGLSSLLDVTRVQQHQQYAKPHGHLALSCQAERSVDAAKSPSLPPWPSATPTTSIALATRPHLPLPHHLHALGDGGQPRQQVLLQVERVVRGLEELVVQQLRSGWALGGVLHEALGHQLAHGLQVQRRD